MWENTKHSPHIFHCNSITALFNQIFFIYLVPVVNSNFHFPLHLFEFLEHALPWSSAHKQQLQVDCASYPNHKLRNSLHYLNPAVFCV